MTPTKEQQAQEYAEKKFPELLLTIKKEPWPETLALLAKAFLDGYTACEQSMWRSVEELPDNDSKVFVIIRGAYVCGRYDHKYESWEIFGMGSYNRKVASYWMPIPSLPDPNAEKK